MDIKKIPKELLEKRDVIECNFVLSLYKDISLLNEYRNVTNEEDIITEDGVFYFGLIKALKKAGYSTVDNMSVYTFLEDKKKAKDEFDKRGGWNTIKEITSLLSTDNIDAYYDELSKSNMLIRLNKNGFNVLDNIDKFKNMSCEEVYSFYEYQLANISIDKIEKLKSEDLTTGYDKYIEEWDKGEMIGFPISSKMLNHQLLGTHKKNLLLHLAGIGNGKTTSAIHWYILPVIEQSDVTIIGNEQSVNEWRQMLLATVLFNKIGKVDGFSRNKIMKGHYEDFQKEKMYEAAEWLESQPGKINFIETQDYSIANVKKIMSKYSALGCSMFIVDTLKPMNDSSDRAWGEFSEVAKQLFIEAKKNDACVIATCQLSPEAMSRRYLDLTCIAKAKAIAETATQVVMFRDITQEEKKKIKGFMWEGKVKKIVELDENKDYIMVFTPKNRFGSVKPQIIMERNMNFNTFKDTCWYHCEYDQFRTR